MDRLTYFENGWHSDASREKIIEKLAKYESTGIEPESLLKHFNEEAILNFAANILNVDVETLKGLKR